TVDGNGLVTAIGQGVATITATSTADAAAAAAAAVTVNPDPGSAPVTISIKSITFGNTLTPVDPQNTFGTIQATVNLEGSPPAVVDRVELLVDGTVVYTQSFTTGGGAEEAAADEAQAVEIVASIP